MLPSWAWRLSGAGPSRRAFLGSVLRLRGSSLAPLPPWGLRVLRLATWLWLSPS